MKCRKKLKIVLEAGAFTPERAHETDAGLDIRSMVNKVIPAHGAAVFHTGVHIQLPKNTCGILTSKSGLYIKKGITSTGLIDEGYTGQIMVRLENHSNDDYFVNAGDKISQLIIVPVYYAEVVKVDTLDKSDRGDNGFGSSGR